MSGNFAKHRKCSWLQSKLGFPRGSDGKESACNARDPYSSGTFLSVKYAAETKIPVILVLSF